jgi:hypothetical protein
MLIVGQFPFVVNKPVYVGREPEALNPYKQEALVHKVTNGT